MNATPVNQQIAGRISELADELIAAGAFREAGELQELMLETSAHPALYFDVGNDEPDARGAEAEDTRGYNLAFLLSLWITTSGNAKKLNEEIRRLIGLVQEKIESDPKLNELAKWVEYLGYDRFVSANGQAGGAVVTYRVYYRRVRGQPDVNY